MMSKLLNLFDRVTLFLLVGWPEPERAKVKAVAENRARAANLCGVGNVDFLKIVLAHDRDPS